MQRLEEAVGATSYPGRGILIGKSGDGEHFVIAYFIMGRSENSRNRIFIADGQGIKTKAFDESKMTDPSLIIYAPVRVLPNGDTIVTNGDQTDTIFECMVHGGAFEEALRTRTFEPDSPNYTPRISGLVEPGENRYRLSILKSADGNPASTQRFFFEYADPLAGEGHFIHTYQQDGNPLPSFSGEPERVALPAEMDIDAFTNAIWEHLDKDNKVSLFTRFIQITTGQIQSRIVNRHTDSL